MPIPFCQNCGCVADEDQVWCDECLPEELEKIAKSHVEEKKVSTSDTIPINGKCRSCKADVIWVTMTPSLKPTPIDPALEHGGNVEIRANASGKLYAKVTGPDAEQRKYISHFASCRDAKTWRTGMIQTAMAIFDD